jgi:predicted DCC family thiol-disulfide oxidoreductase YuxK
MPRLERPRYSYREDPAVPSFDDSRPLFLFDGACVLCSGGASFLMRHDKRAIVAFASAQSSLGSALYRHFGMPIDDSYLLLIWGEGFSKSEGYFRLFREMGGVWRLLNLARIVPVAVSDWLYDRVAANRYDWFGKTDYCRLLSSEQRNRLLDG